MEATWVILKDLNDGIIGDVDLRRWVKDNNLDMKFEEGEFDVGVFLAKLVNDSKEDIHIHELRYLVGIASLLLGQGYVNKVNMELFLEAYKKYAFDKDFAERLHLTYLRVFEDLDIFDFHSEKLKKVSLVYALDLLLSSVNGVISELGLIRLNSTEDELYVIIMPVVYHNYNKLNEN